MEWKKIDIEPESDMDCLVIKKSQNWIQHLCWNAFHKCWDDRDGDDFDCKKEDVLYWMPFPEQPTSERFIKKESSLNGLIEALKRTKDFCKKTNDCRECELRNKSHGGSCKVMNYPKNWVI